MGLDEDEERDYNPVEHAEESGEGYAAVNLGAYPDVGQIAGRRNNPARRNKLNILEVSMQICIPFVLVSMGSLIYSPFWTEFGS